MDYFFLYSPLFTVVCAFRCCLHGLIEIKCLGWTKQGEVSVILGQRNSNPEKEAYTHFSDAELGNDTPLQ